MKKTAIIFSIIILVVSCSPKFTEINDQGFGGGMKVNQIKRSNKNESELNLSLESKKDKLVINSEIEQTGLLDSTELTTVQSNINKQEIKPNKTVAKLNQIFYPLMPKSVNQKFEKTIKSKSNIFGYQGDNDGMTIGFNMFIYGLFASIFSYTILVFMVFSILGGRSVSNMPSYIVLGFFLELILLLSLICTVVGGLIFLVSWLVS